MDGRPVNEATAKRFGRNVFMARRRAGLSQQELAQRCSLHRTHIGCIEHGQRLPRVDTLVKLAAGLEARAEDLLGGIEWTLPPPPRPGGAFAIRPPA
jgi:transcriptional regulator with XRE-family HTH domain